MVGAGGTNLYHSNYDSFQFYEQFVDPEFQMGPMVEQMAGLMALRLANGDLISYNLNKYPADLKMHFDAATAKIKNTTSNLKVFKKLLRQLKHFKKQVKNLLLK